MELRLDVLTRLTRGYTDGAFGAMTTPLNGERDGRNLPRSRTGRLAAVRRARRLSSRGCRVRRMC